MVYKNNIIFLSDNLNTINSYRSDLISELQNNYAYISIYTIRNFIFNIDKIINSQLIISSNIRSNLLALFFFKNNRLIILNGLGRLRNSYLLRYILILLLRFQSNYILSVQNFRDYRWLKINGIDCYLVYGSGGRSFYSNPKGNTVLVISRNSKILLQIKSLVKFAKNFPSTKYEFIGLTREKKKLSIFDSLFRGHLAPKNFFINSNVFFQPSGYSEGFPHTLADALCSSCKIFMERKMFIFLGLHKVIRDYDHISDFVMIPPNDKYIDFFGSRPITKRYIELISLFDDFS